MNMLNILLYFLIFTLFKIEVYSSEIALQYGLLAKKDGNVAIKKFFIFSERCSGSNYAEILIRNNLNIGSSPFCHKHFPPWYELPLEKYLGNPKYYTFEGTDEYLFILIFRNPYDWVRSLYQNPWHADTFLKDIPFEQFISTVWQIGKKDKDLTRLQNLHPLLDRNPKNGCLFKNVLKLRTEKIRNMLFIKNKAKNCYYINYEKLRDFPEETLSEISTIFQVSRKMPFTPVIHRKGRPIQGVYQPKDYITISPGDLEFINSQLDPNLEKEIGYTLIN